MVEFYRAIALNGLKHYGLERELNWEREKGEKL
jgi:hypothetical protein